MTVPSAVVSIGQLVDHVEHTVHPPAPHVPVSELRIKHDLTLKSKRIEGKLQVIINSEPKDSPPIV